MLTQSLPPSLSLLTGLSFLYLDAAPGAALTGDINVLSTLTNLYYFHACGNSFSGTMPHWMFVRGSEVRVSLDQCGVSRSACVAGSYCTSTTLSLAGLPCSCQPGYGCGSGEWRWHCCVAHRLCPRDWATMLHGNTLFVAVRVRVGTVATRTMGRLDDSGRRCMSRRSVQCRWCRRVPVVSEGSICSVSGAVCVSIVSSWHVLKCRGTQRAVLDGVRPWDVLPRRRRHTAALSCWPIWQHHWARGSELHGRVPPRLVLSIGVVVTATVSTRSVPVWCDSDCVSGA